MKVLLAQQDRDLLKALNKTLSKEMEVKEAFDGVIALQCIREEAFDLIILDEKLPRIEGKELITKIRNENNNTPILVMTQESTISYKTLIKALPVDDYLEAYYTSTTLKKLIHDLVNYQQYLTEKKGYDFALEERYLLVGKEKKDLTQKEYRLLALLLDEKVHPIEELYTILLDKNIFPYIAAINFKLKQCNSCCTIKLNCEEGYELKHD